MTASGFLAATGAIRLRAKTKAVQCPAAIRAIYHSGGNMVAKACGIYYNKYMQFKMLKKHLQEQKPAACYILTGEDDYIIRTACQNLRALAGDMTDFNLRIFGDGCTSSEIVFACRAMPVMHDIAVVEVRGFTKDAGELVKYLADPSPSTVLVIVAPVLTKNLSAIMSVACLVECSKQDEASLRKWIEKKCSELNSQITAEAALRIIGYCSGFMSRISTETEKLASYKYGGIIESADVEKLVMPEPEYKIYELGDSIIGGRRETCVKMLAQIMDSEPASYIISGLYSYFRRMLYSVISKDASTATYLGVKEFAVVAARRQASALSPKKLKSICDRLQAADFDFKSGRMTDKVAAETFVIQTVSDISEN